MYISNNNNKYRRDEEGDVFWIDRWVNALVGDDEDSQERFLAIIALSIGLIVFVSFLCCAAPSACCRRKDKSD